MFLSGVSHSSLAFSSSPADSLALSPFLPTPLLSYLIIREVKPSESICTRASLHMGQCCADVVTAKSSHHASVIHYCFRVCHKLLSTPCFIEMWEFVDYYNRTDNLVFIFSYEYCTHRFIYLFIFGGGGGESIMNQP